jgi:hypothetical protein
MAQGIRPFQYEIDKKPGGMTALAGLPLYLDLAHLIGLRRLISEHVRARQGDRGWTDDQIVIALVLLNLAGGTCVEDIRALEGDEGSCRVFREVEFAGRTRSEQRALKRSWRKERTRTLPSVTAVREYLELFHSQDQEHHRKPHEAFRKAALYCYKKFKAYQPLNVYWAEQGMMLFSEFRDCNVPVDYDLLRSFNHALDLVPLGVKKVYLRSETAAYVVELLKYCAEGKNERFGVIEFAVGADMTQEFKKAVVEVPQTAWHTLYREVNCRVQAGAELRGLARSEGCPNRGVTHIFSEYVALNPPFWVTCPARTLFSHLPKVTPSMRSG